MTRLAKKLSSVNITDSKKKKIRDYAAEEWEQPTAEWEELLEAVDHDVLLREIFAAWSADEANDMIAHLKRVLDFNPIDDSKHKVEDKAWTEADHAAAFAIDTKDVIDLYIDGIIEVNIPSGINSKEFADACINLCKELWSDKEINFDYGNANFEYIINDNILTILIK